MARLTRLLKERPSAQAWRPRGPVRVLRAWGTTGTRRRRCSRARQHQGSSKASGIRPSATGAAPAAHSRCVSSWSLAYNLAAEHVPQAGKHSAAWMLCSSSRYCSAAPHCCSRRRQAATIKEVVIVSMFEIGEDTGDVLRNSILDRAAQSHPGRGSTRLAQYTCTTMGYSSSAPEVANQRSNLDYRPRPGSAL